jgi:hypothetical protein
MKLHSFIASEWVRERKVIFSGSENILCCEWRFGGQFVLIFISNGMGMGEERRSKEKIKLRLIIKLCRTLIVRKRHTTEQFLMKKFFLCLFSIDSWISHTHTHLFSARDFFFLFFLEPKKITFAKLFSFMAEKKKFKKNYKIHHRKVFISYRVSGIFLCEDFQYIWVSGFFLLLSYVFISSTCCYFHVSCWEHLLDKVQ